MLKCTMMHKEMSKLNALSILCFFPTIIIATCMYIHYHHRGKAPDIAVEKFLRKTQELDSYGAKFHHVQVHVCVCMMTLLPVNPLHLSTYMYMKAQVYSTLHS